MGQAEDAIAIEQQIQVQQTRPPTLSPHPPELLFYPQQRLEQIQRPLIGCQDRAGVEVVGLGRTYGTGLVQRGSGQDSQIRLSIQHG